MYKIKSLFLTVVLLIYGVSPIVFAENEESLPMMKGFDIKIIEIEDDYGYIMPFSLSHKSIEEHIFDECNSHSELISLDGYSLTIDELSDLISAHSEFMIYAGGFNAWVYTNTGYVAYFEPKYLFDSVEADEEARTLIAEQIKYYTDYAKEKSNDALEQLLLAHDKLIHDVYYDFEYEDLSFHAYGMLANGKGVCQGYSEIIYMMAKEFGIEAWFCSSKANGEIDINGVPQMVGHIWNYIKLDDEWYHLDATWNDPDSSEKNAGIYDLAYHGYFLVTDETMSDHETEYEWIVTLDKKPVCDSDKYEKNHFFNIAQLCEITYGDGYLQTALKAGNSTIELRTYDGLYTGPVIISKVEETNSSYKMYYYFLEDLRNFDVMVKAHEYEKLKEFKKYSKTVPDGYNFQYGIVQNTIPKTDFSQAQDLTMYIWDISTLKPLSQKVELN